MDESPPNPFEAPRAAGGQQPSDDPGYAPLRVEVGLVIWIAALMGLVTTIVWAIG